MTVCIGTCLKTDRLIMRQNQKSKVSDTLTAGAGVGEMEVMGIAGAERAENSAGYAGGALGVEGLTSVATMATGCPHGQFLAT
jgi:hypothetical protein